MSDQFLPSASDQELDAESRREYQCQADRWDGGPYADDDFWNAYEIVTGEKVSDRNRGSIFSFSCAC